MYDTSIVPRLEDYLLQQIKLNHYDFHSNRHLLSLYLLQPDLMKHDILKLILLTALMSIPSNHFLSISYLLPLPLQQQEPYKFIFRLASLLSQCQFKRFWIEKKTREKEITIKGFDSAIRHYIAYMVTRLYSRVSVYTMMELWNYETRKEVEEECKKYGWSMEDERHKIIRVKNHSYENKTLATTSLLQQQHIGDVNDLTSSNSKREKKKEILSVEQLSKLLAIA